MREISQHRRLHFPSNIYNFKDQIRGVSTRALSGKAALANLRF
jgi:hypothetical protein